MLFQGLILLAILVNGKSSPIWTYVCNTIYVEEDGLCEKQFSRINESVQSLATCRLRCGTQVLWPQPREFVSSHNVTWFSADDILLATVPLEVSFSRPNEDGKRLLDQATLIFKETLAKMYPPGIKPTATGVKFYLYASIKDANSRFVIGETSEEYILSVTNDGNDGKTTTIKAEIKAETFYGARHGLETLSQLLAYDNIEKNLVVVTDATVVDSPVYPYRGILIDTARNYVTVNELKKVINGMSMNKLNHLHWHITDSASFPLVISSQPNMTLYGAYSPDMVYSKTDVNELIEYANLRGVVIVPEIDAPSHTASGWQWGESAGLGTFVACLNIRDWMKYCDGPPCGQLNPANQQMYDVLYDIYNDVIDMFKAPNLFHMGGDEIKIECWKTSEEIQNYVYEHSLSYMDLWAEFQRKALNAIQKHYGTDKPVSTIIWTSKLTIDGNLQTYLNNKDYIIQIWTKIDDEQVNTLLENNYRIILSNSDALYLDCGFGSWVGPPGVNWCSPYKDWKTIYENDPKKLLKNWDVKGHLVLGGEAALWTEEVDDLHVGERIWPRASAMAERFWTDPTQNYQKAERRLVYHRDRMARRGITPAAIQPLWCLQNEAMCFSNPPSFAAKANSNSFLSYSLLLTALIVLCPK